MKPGQDVSETGVMEWTIQISLWRDRVIRTQLGLGIGIPFGILCLVLVFVGAWQGLVLVGLLFVLTFLLVSFIYRGGLALHYVIDDKGILCENRADQAKRVRRMAGLTFVLGLLTRNPTAAGAGLLGGTRTREFLSWKGIRKVRVVESNHCLLVRAGPMSLISVHCPPELFAQVRSRVEGSASRASCS